MGHAPIGETASGRIKARIRADILANHIRSGERIKIAELAGRYGISQMPVREALHGLEGEGLLRIEGNRGATVREVTPEFVQDVSNARRVLEMLLVEQAALRIRADALHGLRAIQAILRASAAAGDTLGMVQANRRFHQVIYAAGGNTEARRMLENGWELVNGLRLTFGYDPLRAFAVADEHDALVDALSRRDAAAARANIDQHCRNSCDHLLIRMAANAVRGTTQ